MNRRGIILTLTLALFAALTVFGQTPQRTYTVMFYNLENLFDTINDPRRARRGVHARGCEEMERHQVLEKTA